MSSTRTKERLKGSTKDYFSSETVMGSLRSIGSIRHKFTRSLIFSLGALALIVVIGAMVRSLPIRWGFYLTEFDPYWQYHQTQYIVDHGYLAWFSWHDNTVWFPWGRSVAQSSYPGIPFSAAALYTFLNVLGLNLTVFDVCVIWPVLMGVLTIILVYFLGKDIGGKEVGLFSALFIALSASHISRTSLGFFDDETVGVFTLVLVALLFLRSLDSRRTLKGTILYAIATGLSLGYLQATWGASIYVVSLIALFAGVLIVFRKYSRRLLVSYSVTMSIAFLIAIQVPRIGVGFLTQLPTLSAIGMTLLLCMMEFTRNIQNSNMRIASFGVFFIALGSTYLLLEYFGLVSPLVAKFISVLNPFERVTQPLIESVAEHRPATWASFFYEMGSILFIAPLGFYFLLRRSNVRDLFVVLLGITALYFAASMVRLTLILAPALAILASVAVVELVKPFINIARETVIFSKKRRFVPKVGREFGAIFVIILLLLVFPPLSRAVDSSYTPTTLASSSLPVRPTDTNSFDDWIQALSWMKDNLPRESVVAAWWDYGYWITVIGNHTTLADNGTINSTQIAQIGQMFLSNETQAIKILKDHDVTHVVVFVTWSSYTSSTTSETDVKFYGFGEDGKWRWMARIAGLNETEFEETTKDSDGNSYGIPNANTVLGKMIWNGIGGSPVSSYSAPEHFNLVFASTSRWVLVYQVNYTGVS